MILHKYYWSPAYPINRIIHSWNWSEIISKIRQKILCNFSRWMTINFCFFYSKEKKEVYCCNLCRVDSSHLSGNTNSCLFSIRRTFPFKIIAMLIALPLNSGPCRIHTIFLKIYTRTHFKMDLVKRRVFFHLTLIVYALLLHICLSLAVVTRFHCCFFVRLPFDFAQLLSILSKHMCSLHFYAVGNKTKMNKEKEKTRSVLPGCFCVLTRQILSMEI